jgi:NTE family protein
MAHRRKVALVIGSGSVKCAAALGLQRVLERESIAIDMVVGCSGGSIYAATIALGWPAEKAIDVTLKLWTREITSRRRRKAILEILLPKVFGFDQTFGLVDDRLILDRLRQAFGDTTFAQAGMPFYVSATDLFTGEQVLLSQGSIVAALRGSMAIPYILPPYRVGDRYLLDGYLSDPLPVGVAIREGADVIIAIGFESPHQARINSLSRYALQLSSITSNNLLRSNFAFHNLAHHSEIIPIIPEFKERIGLFDTDKIPYIVEEGERAAVAQVPYLRALLEVAP